MNTHMNNDRNAPISQKEILLYRTLLALALIVLAAALRIAPHPWNFTPVGAMALFSGAVLKDPRALRRRPLHRLPQINPHRLRQFPRQRSHRPLAPRPPHRRPHQSRHAPRRHPVFPRHQFRCLVAPRFLSQIRGRISRLLFRRRPLLLEHPRGRRPLRHAALRRLRPGGALLSSTPGTCAGSALML